MPYRVLLQKDHSSLYTDTGVIETNPDQRKNWQDICTHCGYADFKFLPLEPEYHLVVRKRVARQRKKATSPA